MHVMIVNNIYPPIIAGGADIMVTYLSEGLVRRGHRVTVVSTCGPDMEPYPDENRNGVEVIRFFPSNLYWSFDRPSEPGIKKWLWHARDAWNTHASRRFRAIMREKKPDILHTHVIDGLSASIWASAREMGIPVIHTAHDYHLLCPRAFLLTANWKICSQPRAACRAFRNWHLQTTRYVDMFVSPSRFLLDMHLQAGLKAKAAAIVHNGIPLPTPQKDLVKTPPTEGRLRFLLLTRLTVEKGVSVVLDAIGRLPPNIPVELEIAGTGLLEGSVRETAARDSRVKYLGFISGQEKAEALSRAHCLLLPSLWYENAPVVIAEAISKGVGVVASDIGGIPEFVAQNRTGFLFPPGDSVALAELMLRLVRDRTLLTDCADHTRLVAPGHNVERMISEYETHYTALVYPTSVFQAAE